MISRTSLFNKGIYKSTLKRYLWGSVLYFILLFMVTGMTVLLTVDPERTYTHTTYDHWSLILTNEYILLPMLLAMGVPTVVGLMIFRFIHAKRTSVFVHSLPVKRMANYISSVMAGLTLMSVPVVLNSLLLMIISACGYSQLFTTGDCVIWMLLNLLALFIMFSCVCFVASITGNSFAMVALNVLFHCFALIFAAGFSIVAEVFLYGFANENEIISKVAENTFPVRLISEASVWGYENTGSGLYIIKFLVIALALYVIAALLYKKRRIETAEDVAGFKCLNPIFKYALTFIGAIAAFSIFSYSMQDNMPVFWCIIALASAVVYFASEMLLKKTLRVWRSYKGYLGFAAVFALMMCMFAFTSFFGYETRIPDSAEVSKVALYDYYQYEKPYHNDREILAKVMLIHGDTITDKERLRTESENYFHIEYELKNGKTIHRRYGVSNERLYEIMNSMYQNDGFKKTNEDIFTEMESVYGMRIYGNYTAEDIAVENSAELVECIKKDIEELSYSQIYCEGWGVQADIEYVPEKQDELTTARAYRYDAELSKQINYMDYHINPNFTRTIAWLKENGYREAVSIKNHGTIYICKEYEELPFVDSEGKRITAIDPEKEKNIIKLDDEERLTLINYIQEAPQDYIRQSDRYYIYRLINLETMEYDSLGVITMEKLGELFPDR